MSAYPDEQLVLEALDDSHLAFEQLVEQYQYRVLRTIASIVSDEQAAQDVAQETFLAAWRDLPKLKAEHKFGGPSFPNNSHADPSIALQDREQQQRRISRIVLLDVDGIQRHRKVNSPRLTGQK